VALELDPCLTPEQHRLRDLISDVSERCWAASWMSDTEFEVWRLTTEGGSWGQGDVGDLAGLLARVQALAQQLDAWIVPSDHERDCDHEPREQAIWRQEYASWRLARPSWTVPRSSALASRSSPRRLHTRFTSRGERWGQRGRPPASDTGQQ